jgi:tetratricopeptide (TPR) repeat protein
MTLPETKRSDFSKRVLDLFVESAFSNTNEVAVFSLLREIESYRKACPGDFDINCEIGSLYCLLNNEQKTRKYLELYIKHGDDKARGHNNYAVCLGNFEKYEEAINHAKEAVRLANNMAQYWSVLVQSYYNAKRYEDVIEGAKKAGQRLNELPQKIIEFQRKAIVKVKIKKYSSLPPRERIERGSDEDYAKALDEEFDELSNLRKNANIHSLDGEPVHGK